MDLGSPAISGGIAAVLTPLLMWALMRIFPARPRSEFSEIPPDELRRRNGWIEYGVTAVFFVGLFVGVGYYMTGASPYDPLGASIGGVIAGLGPLVFVLLMTGRSIRRFNEYLYFCEMNHGIGRTGLTVIWAPVVFVGLLSLLYLGHRAAI